MDEVYLTTLLSFLYVCMVIINQSIILWKHHVNLLSRKFIIAKVSIRKLRSSSVLMIC